MSGVLRLAVLVVACVAAARPAAAADAALFRLFLTDGTFVTSYGEFARVDDRVIFSMLAGGTADAPRLHVATLPAHLIDWARTDRYAQSARAQRYAETRGDTDFSRLTSQVAGALNSIALTTDRPKALAIATDARKMLATWPRDHYGYRDAEVRGYIGVLDDAITSLSGAPAGVFELALVADVPPIALEPVAPMPTRREQVEQALRVADLTDRAAERVAVLESALQLLAEPVVAGAAVEAGLSDTRALRRTIETRLRRERDVDARYAKLSREMTRTAARSVADADAADVQRLIDRLPKEDARLGAQRGEAMHALRVSLQAQLDAARQLRLLLDRWSVVRVEYRQYEKTIRPELAHLVKSRPALEEIRRVEGPSPGRLVELRNGFSGGAQRLERVPVSDALRQVHDLLVSAWRFAESAVTTRYEAVTSGSLPTATQASSSAAAALLLIGRAETSVTELLKRPTLQ
jgi:hypothetical protein